MSIIIFHIIFSALVFNLVFEKKSLLETRRLGLKQGFKNLLFRELFRRALQYEYAQHL